MRKIPLGNLNSNNPIKTPVKKYHASVARQSPRERNRLLACKNFAFTHANVHMMLEATELGLGTVWVCYFQPDVIRKEFDLPDNLEPINILVIGYGNEAPSDTERHEHMRIPLTDLISYEKL